MMAADPDKLSWEFFRVIGLDIQIEPHQLFLGGKKRL